MPGPFTSFVILGAMRTGSNFLESSLNEAEGITCHGEVFNPEFIGRINAEDLFGVTRAERDADPLPLLDRMREGTEGLAGFRFFQDHDPRVLKAVLDDPACAKIVLGRNPLHSYVSLRIAQKTGQWMLVKETRRREAKISFDPDEFEAYLKANLGFYGHIRQTLHHSGQTAFYLDYDELQDAAVLNGLLAWLGVEGRLKTATRRVKKQNEINVMDRVDNPRDVLTAMARIEFLDPRFRQYAERVARADVKSFVASPDAPLIYLPVACRHAARVEGWMGALGGTGPEGLMRQMNGHAVRMWCQANPGFRSFTVVSHPAERAHDTFMALIGNPDPAIVHLRHRLRSMQGPDLPDTFPAEGYDLDRHRALFLTFLDYVRLNLGGRTGLPPHPLWGTQAAALEAICSFKVPDLVLRAETLDGELAALAGFVGLEPPPVPAPVAPEGFGLDQIYDAEVERAVHAAYDRDYDTFGFTDWGSTRP